MRNTKYVTLYYLYNKLPNMWRAILFALKRSSFTQTFSMNRGSYENRWQKIPFCVHTTRLHSVNSVTCIKIWIWKKYWEFFLRENVLFSHIPPISGVKNASIGSIYGCDQGHLYSTTTLLHHGVHLQLVRLSGLAPRNGFVLDIIKPSALSSYFSPQSNGLFGT